MIFTYFVVRDKTSYYGIQDTEWNRSHYENKGFMFGFWGAIRFNTLDDVKERLEILKMCKHTGEVFIEKVTVETSPVTEER